MTIDDAIKTYSEQWINTSQVKKMLNISSDQTIARIINEIYDMELAVRWIGKEIETTPGAVMEYSKRITAQKMEKRKRK